MLHLSLASLTLTLSLAIRFIPVMDLHTHSLHGRAQRLVAQTSLLR